MKHCINNNLLKLLFLGETNKSFESLKQLIDLDLLPLELQLKSNLSQALIDLHTTDPALFPQAILVNVDVQPKQLFRFIEQYELLIAPQAPATLLFLASSRPSMTSDTLLQRFPFISGFIEKPYDRGAIEQIARKLLLLSEASFLQLDFEVA